MNELDFPTDDERTMATLAHLSAFVAPLVGPVIILMVYNEKSRFVRYHAIQALVMSCVLGALVVMSTIVTMIIGILTCGIGQLLMIPLLMLVPLPPCYEAWMAWQGKMTTVPGLEAIGR